MAETVRLKRDSPPELKRPWQHSAKPLAAALVLMLSACQAGEHKPSSASRITSSSRTEVPTLTVEPDRICISGSSGKVPNYCIKDNGNRKFILTKNGALILSVTGMLNYGKHKTYQWDGEIWCVAAAPDDLDQDVKAGTNLTIFSFDDGRLEVMPDALACSDGTEITPDVTSKLKQAFDTNTVTH